MKRILFLSASLIVLLMQQISAQGGFTIYDRFNSPLPENQCRFVRIDSQNRKWFCTEYGLAIFNDTTWSVYLTSNSGIPDNSVKHVAFDNLGNAWISTQNGGVGVFDGTNWTVYNTSNSGIASNYIRSITIDSQNKNGSVLTMV